MLSIVIGILSGFGFPLQTCVNTVLRRKLGSTFRASFVSFLVALIFLLCLLPFTVANAGIPLQKIWQEPLWIWMGGMCGITVLIGNILLFPRIGSMQTVILPIFGQILMGLSIDHFGFFHATMIPLSLSRILGAILVFMGVMVVSLGKQSVHDKETSATKSDMNLWFWRIFGIAIGTLTSVQTAINSYLGSIVASPVKASLISFAVGISTLTLFCIGERLQKDNISTAELKNSPWWMWTGGFFGAILVLVNIYLGQTIGTGLTIIVVLTGSMIGGLLVDHFALLGAEKKPIRLSAMIGIVVILTGIGLIRL